MRRLHVAHDPAMFQPSPLLAEAYPPPSSEARRLVRRAPWLTSPERGEATAAARLSLRVLVAPMTQLTFCSFELQAFLFLVFHRTRVAILGHGLFMTTENLFLMAALREIPLAQTPVGVVSGAPVYAVLLLAWHAGVAWKARLPGWLAVTLPRRLRGRVSTAASLALLLKIRRLARRRIAGGHGDTVDDPR